MSMLVRMDVISIRTRRDSSCGFRDNPIEGIAQIRHNPQWIPLNRALMRLMEEEADWVVR
jgi:hypothetical protein